MVEDMRWNELIETLGFSDNVISTTVISTTVISTTVISTTVISTTVISTTAADDDTVEFEFDKPFSGFLLQMIIGESSDGVISPPPPWID